VINKSAINIHSINVIITSYIIHGKNGFAEVFKNLADGSENN